MRRRRRRARGRAARTSRPARDARPADRRDAAALPGDRQPVAGVRYSRFDRPHIERARAEVSAAMRAPGRRPRRPMRPRPTQVERLVACPLPLVPILAEDEPARRHRLAGPLLEVLTRRYYRIRALGSRVRRAVGGHERVPRSYVHKGSTVHVARRAGRDGRAAPRRSPRSAERGRHDQSTRHGRRRRVRPVPAGSTTATPTSWSSAAARAAGRRRAARRGPAGRRRSRPAPRPRRAHVPAGRRRR